MKPEMIAMWRGRPCADLTREELIEAYTHAVAELEDMRRMWASDLQMERLFEHTERTLRRRTMPTMSW